MTGLYVKLDVEYMSNPKLLEAGPLAELLYVRSLCFAKRTMKDGVLTRPQVGLITYGVPNAKRHIEALVAEELWDDIGGGAYRIAGWLERNKSASQIEHESEVKRQASILANHERWHATPDGKPSATCPLCYPNPHPKPDRKARSTKTEEEEEEETKAESEAQSEEETNRSSSVKRNITTGAEIIDLPVFQSIDEVAL
jgi:hypothetical protein